MKQMHLFAAIALGALWTFPAIAQDYVNLGGSLFGAYISTGGAEGAVGDFNGEADLTRRTGQRCWR